MNGSFGKKTLYHTAKDGNDQTRTHIKHVQRGANLDPAKRVWMSRDFYIYNPIIYII